MGSISIKYILIGALFSVSIAQGSPTSLTSLDCPHFLQTFADGPIIDENQFLRELLEQLPTEIVSQLSDGKNTSEIIVDSSLYTLLSILSTLLLERKISEAKLKEVSFVVLRERNAYGAATEFFLEENKIIAEIKPQRTFNLERGWAEFLFSKHQPSIGYMFYGATFAELDLKGGTISRQVQLPGTFSSWAFLDDRTIIMSLLNNIIYSSVRIVLVHLDDLSSETVYEKRVKDIPNEPSEQPELIVSSNEEFHFLRTHKDMADGEKRLLFQKNKWKGKHIPGRTAKQSWWSPFFFRTRKFEPYAAAFSGDGLHLLILEPTKNRNTPTLSLRKPQSGKILSSVEIKYPLDYYNKVITAKEAPRGAAVVNSNLNHSLANQRLFSFPWYINFDDPKNIQAIQAPDEVRIHGEDNVLSVALTSDGEYMALGFSNGEVMIVDDNYQRVAKFQAHDPKPPPDFRGDLPQKVISMKFSPQAEFLITLTDRHEVRTWMLSEILE